MAKRFVCWRCGEALHDIPKPFPRLEKCRACGADLHVCYMCRYYNPRMNDHCDHELAEAAREPDLANFCHYLRLRPEAYTKQFDKAQQAAAELKALFGDDDERVSGASSQTNKQADVLDPLKALFQDEPAANSEKE